MKSQQELVEHANKLLDLARRAAVSTLGPVKATRHNLDRLAAHTRNAILSQARLGFWTPLGAPTDIHLRGIVVTANYGNTLKGEPPILLTFDFTHTSIPMLKVMN